MSVFQQFFGSATAIVNQTNAGSNSLVAGIGGGGGGPIGPNPSVSSINVNWNGGVECRFSTLNATSIPGSAEVNFDHDTVPDATTSLVYDGRDGVSSLSVYIKANSYFPGTLNVAELKGVSTINGVLPGGSVGPSLALSTLYVAGSSPLDGSQLSVGGLNPNGILFNYVSSATTFGQIEMLRSVNGGPNGGVKMNGGQDGATIQVGNNAVSLTSDGGTSANVITVAETKGGNILMSANNGNGIITLSAGTLDANQQNCDLQISSINGVKPSGAAFSTIGLTITGQMCDPLISQPIVAFSTIPGHVYSASVQMRATIDVGTTATDSVLSEIVDDNAGNDAIGSWPASQIASLTASSYFQQIGGVKNWKAGGTNASLNVFATVSTTALIDAVNLIDYGAI